MVIMVVDGQGGGIGRVIIEKLRAGIDEGHEIMAVGINAMATMGMMKAGAKNIATGENAVIFNSKRADIIVGSIGIVAANSDRKSTRLNSSHLKLYRMPSSA